MEVLDRASEVPVPDTYTTNRYLNHFRLDKVKWITMAQLKHGWIWKPSVINKTRLLRVYTHSVQTSATLNPVGSVECFQEINKIVNDMTENLYIYRAEAIEIHSVWDNNVCCDN